jgi:hypothetical protein
MTRDSYNSKLKGAIKRTVQSALYQALDPKTNLIFSKGKADATETFKPGEFDECAPRLKLVIAYKLRMSIAYKHKRLA